MFTEQSEMSLRLMLHLKYDLIIRDMNTAAIVSLTMSNNKHHHSQVISFKILSIFLIRNIYEEFYKRKLKT